MEEFVVLHETKPSTIQVQLLSLDVPQRSQVKEGKGICQHTLLTSSFTTAGWKCGIADWGWGNVGLWNGVGELGESAP